MRLIILVLGLFLSAIASSATLESALYHPSAPIRGPKSLVAARVYYGTCNGDSFGIWEGGKTMAMPVSVMRFKDLPYRRTCTQAYWKQRNGKWLGPSAVSIAEAL